MNVKNNEAGKWSYIKGKYTMWSHLYEPLKMTNLMYSDKKEIGGSLVGWCRIKCVKAKTNIFGWCKI